MEQEKELLQNQNTWLNSELKTKTEELLSVSRDKGKEILELKCSLECKKDEVLYHKAHWFYDYLCKYIIYASISPGCSVIV